MQNVLFRQVYLSLLGTESKHGCLLRTLRFIKFFLLFSPVFKLHDYSLGTHSVPLCGVPGINQRKATMLALKEILTQTGFMVPCCYALPMCNLPQVHLLKPLSSMCRC